MGKAPACAGVPNSNAMTPIAAAITNLNVYEGARMTSVPYDAIPTLRCRLRSTGMFWRSWTNAVGSGSAIQ
jgi:hypothetical protein